MMRIFLPLICAALGLAAASCSPSEGSFAPTEAASPPSGERGSAPAGAASPDHTAQADGMTENPPGADDTATATDPSLRVVAQSLPKSTASAGTQAELRASALIGMPVTAIDGSPLGKVKDIIFDPQGRATHVVIAYDTQVGPEEIPDGKPRPRPDGKLAAMPWDTAVARVDGGKLVLDGAKLRSAPSFTADTWPNLQDPAWSALADAYWRKMTPPPVAAHRSTQIDSTARLRARPTRDGE